MNDENLEIVRSALRDLGRPQIDIPNLVYAEELAVRFASKEAVHVFIDVGLANQYGKHGPGSKHFSSMYVVPDQLIQTRQPKRIVDFLVGSRHDAIVALKKLIESGKETPLFRPDDEMPPEAIIQRPMMGPETDHGEIRSP